MGRSTSDTRAGAPAAAWRNWAGNQQARATEAVAARSITQVAEAVAAAAAAGRRVKPVGTGHSFSDIACAGDVRLDMSTLDGLISVDRANRLVTVQAGMPLWRLNELLAAQGLAMPNLGDIDRQTVGGAISTGTHGTGAGLGCLASFVAGLTLVTPAGEVLRCSPTAHPDVFDAARVGLGALGVLVEVTLRCVDAFVLLADERPMPLGRLLAELDTHVAGNDHVDVFWFPYTETAQIKRNNRFTDNDRPLSRLRAWLDDDFLANTVLEAACRVGRAAPRLIPTINRVASRVLTPRVYTGPSHDVFCTPRRVRFTEMEYSVPRAALPEALAQLWRILADLPFKVNFPVEVRFTGPDDIWLSHSYGRDSAYVAVQQYARLPYEPFFRAFERVCVDLEGRPHWGKLHYRDAESLRPVYPRFDDFRAVRDRLDPGRVLANPYLDRVLGA
jgi:L-gulono-1,4-lactone dehydrogenase